MDATGRLWPDAVRNQFTIIARIRRSRECSVYAAAMGALHFTLKVFSDAAVAEREHVALTRLPAVPGAVLDVKCYTQVGRSSVIVVPLYGGGTLREWANAPGRTDTDICEPVMQILRRLVGEHMSSMSRRDVDPLRVFLQCGVFCHIDYGDFVVWLNAFAPSPVGTLSYAPPEVWNGEAYGPAAYMWSIGVILYAHLVGHRPFDEGRRAHTPTDDTAYARVEAIFSTIDDYNAYLGALAELDALPELVKPLATVTRRCLEIASRRRPTAVQFATALESFMRGAGRRRERE